MDSTQSIHHYKKGSLYGETCESWSCHACDTSVFVLPIPENEHNIAERKWSPRCKEPPSRCQPQLSTCFFFPFFSLSTFDVLVFTCYSKKETAFLKFHSIRRVSFYLLQQKRNRVLKILFQLFFFLRNNSFRTFVNTVHWPSIFWQKTIFYPIE